MGTKLNSLTTLIKAMVQPSISLVIILPIIGGLVVAAAAFWTAPLPSDFSSVLVNAIVVAFGVVTMVRWNYRELSHPTDTLGQLVIRGLANSAVSLFLGVAVIRILHLLF